MANVLDTAEIDAGTVRIEPIATDLAALIRTVVRDELSDSGNPIQVIGPQFCFVYIDPLRFERVIVNLVENAIKFYRSGQVIVVELQQDLDGTTRLSVTDQGLEFRMIAVKRY